MPRSPGPPRIEQVIEPMPKFYERVAIDFTDVGQSSVKVQVKKAPAQAGAELEVWMV